MSLLGSAVMAWFALALAAVIVGLWVAAAACFGYAFLCAPLGKPTRVVLFFGGLTLAAISWMLTAAWLDKGWPFVKAFLNL